MLKNNFESILGQERTLFKFHLVFYSGNPIYHVTYVDNSKVDVTFRMSQDEEGQWKIMAQVLPTKIHELEMDFNDAIESSQY